VASKRVDVKGRVRWVAPKTKRPIEFPGLDLRAIARRVRTARRERRWSVLALAHVSGLSPATVRKVESGARKASVEALCRLVLAVGVKLDWLVLGRGERKRATDEGSDLVGCSRAAFGIGSGPGDSRVGCPADQVEPAGTGGGVVHDPAPAPRI